MLQHVSVMTIIPLETARKVAANVNVDLSSFRHTATSAVSVIMDILSAVPATATSTALETVSVK